jgi:2'-5' RNA ligase
MASVYSGPVDETIENSMPYTIELQLNRAAESRVLDLWDILRNEKITDFSYRMNYRPHVTLAMYHEMDIARTIAKLERFAAGATPIKVAFRQLAVGKTSILALPVENGTLRKWHARFERRLGRSFRDIDHAGIWMPHCTIGMELPTTELGRAVDKVLAKWAPIEGRLERLALIKFRPGEVLWSKRLR